MNDLFNRPNVDIAADVATVAPVFDANLVQSGPVERKGYTSMVTAGPKTGFGLLPSDNGIAFYNSQSLVSVTPIHDFQQQIERDPQGRKAAKLYVLLLLRLYDWSNLTISAVITPSGLDLIPSATHSVDAAVGGLQGGPATRMRGRSPQHDWHGPGQDRRESYAVTRHPSSSNWISQRRRPRRPRSGSRSKKPSGTPTSARNT